MKKLITGINFLKELFSVNIEFFTGILVIVFSVALFYFASIIS